MNKLQKNKLNKNICNNILKCMTSIPYNKGNYEKLKVKQQKPAISKHLE